MPFTSGTNLTPIKVCSSIIGTPANSFFLVTNNNDPLLGVGMDIESDSELKFLGNIKFPSGYSNEFVQMNMHQAATRLYNTLSGDDLNIIKHTEIVDDTLNVEQLRQSLLLYDNIIVQSFLQRESID